MLKEKMMKRWSFGLFLALLAFVWVVPQAMAAKVPTTTSPKFKKRWNKRNFSHKLLHTVLKRHVRRGKVNYTALRKRSLGLLNEYLYRLAMTPAKSIRGRKSRFAFWINAYNAVTLKAVLDRLPTSYAKQKKFSVLKVKGFWKKYRYQVSRRWVTLDQIENKILRPRFGDPRLHFAIVCASGGCPSLMPFAYTGRRLNRQLTRVTRNFLGSRRAYKRNGNTVKISKLFKWYRKDFTIKPYGHELLFIAKFHPKKKERRWLKKNAKSAKIGYLYYGWNLNVR